MFVVVEGPNGIGKTTFIKALADNLRGSGSIVHTTEEPYRDRIAGSYLRSDGNELRFGEEKSIAMIYAANRYEHWIDFIASKDQVETIVISDRYYMSSMVYQTTALRKKALNVEFAEILRMNYAVGKPDFTIVLTMPTHDLRQRILADDFRHTEDELAQRAMDYRFAGYYIDRYSRAAEFLKKENDEMITELDAGNSISDMIMDVGWVIHDMAGDIMYDDDND